MKICKIGSFIKNERIKQGLTIKELAERAGTTSRALIYWEKGERMPTLICADKVLKVLGVKLVLGAEEDVNK